MSFEARKSFIFMKSRSFVCLLLFILGCLCFVSRLRDCRLPRATAFPFPGPCFFMWVQAAIQYLCISTQGTLQYLPWASAREKNACQGRTLSWEPCGGVLLSPRWGGQCCGAQGAGPTPPSSRPPSLPACLAPVAEEVTHGVSLLFLLSRSLFGFGFLTVRFWHSWVIVSLRMFCLDFVELFGSADRFFWSNLESFQGFCFLCSFSVD